MFHSLFVWSTDAHTPPSAAIAKAGFKCSKCGTYPKSGRRSCCAAGGDWHKKCGSDGNKNAEHTWIEGVQACAGKSSR